MPDFFTVFDGPLLTGGAIFYGLIYMIGALAILLPPISRQWKLSLFAIFNLALVYGVYFSTSTPLTLRFLMYLVFGLAHYSMLRYLVFKNTKSSLFYWLVLVSPLVVLLFTKVSGLAFLGLSYMAFRLSYLAYEVRGNKVKDISIEEYFSFMFFLPTISIGPISPLQMFQSSFGREGAINLSNCYNGTMRIMLGGVKLVFLAPIPQEMTYTNLFLDGLNHNWGDFYISGLAYTLYLYLNFSGFTDVVIGISAIIGVKVKENFNNPFMSTSIVDFWNRWHITLGEYVRDVFYTPITMGLTRRLGVTLLPLWAVLAAMVTFIIVGYWHGTQIGFIIWGVLHGIAFAINVLWGMFLDRKPKLRKKLRGSQIYRVCCIFVAVSFVAVSLFFAELPSPEQMQPVFDVMRESGMI